MSADNFNTAISLARTSIGLTMGGLYGPSAKAFTDIALGNPNYLTQIAAMGEKQTNGTLDSGDYAVLAKILGDVGIGAAVVGGASISVPVGVGWALTGVVLGVYNNRENIGQFLDDLNALRGRKLEPGGDPFTGLPWAGTDGPYETQSPLHTPPTQQSALTGNNTAHVQVREESSAKRQQQAQGQTQTRAPFEQALLRRFEAEQTPATSATRQPAHSATTIHPPATQESRLRPTPGGMSFAEAHKRRDEPEKISAGSLRPVDKAPKPDRLHELTLLREIGIVDAMTEREFGKTQGPGNKSQPLGERAQERPLEQAPAPKQLAPGAASVAAPPAPTRDEHSIWVAPAAQAHTAPISQPQKSAAPPAATAATAEVHPNTDQTTAPAAPTQFAAPEIAAMHAQMAVLQEQIARLTGQRGQGDWERRIGKDEGEATQLTPARASEPPPPRAESAAPPRPSDPRNRNHPDHQDFHKIYAAVANDGRWDAQQSTNIAASVLAEFKANPLGKQVNVVAIEPDQSGKLKVFAGYALQEGKTACLAMAMVDPVQVAWTPAEQGFDKVNQISQQRGLEEQQRTPQDQAMRRA